MRPALEALAEQQRLIQRQAQVIDGLAAEGRRQDCQIAYLTRGLQTLAQLAGVEKRVAAAMIRRADVQNPAQPVPEPPAQPAPHDTSETKTPEAFADVTAPGLVPGSTNDVAADAVSTVYTPGLDVPGPAFKNLVDVTAPVDGTQNPRPLEETKTLTDVRVGDPMNPEVAYPLRGPFQNGQRTSARQQPDGNRTMACLRLAKLRIAAGTAASGDEFEETACIERDAGLSVDAIGREITTLEGVSKAAAARPGASARNLVPRTASGTQRTVPSMQGGTSHAAAVSDSDEALFD